MKKGDKLICIEDYFFDFPMNNQSIGFKKGECYTISKVEDNRYTIMIHIDCGTFNFSTGIEDIKRAFIPLKELRKKKLDEIRKR